MLLFRVILVICVLWLVYFLFMKASGSLKFTKMNMISAIYYYIMAFNLIGASLVYLGLHDHYLIQKIRNPKSYDYTYYALSYSLIMFPLVLLAMKRTVGSFIQRKNIISFVEEGIYYNADMISIQTVALFLIAVCTLATVYVFMNLGYIPIVSMIKGGNLAALRQSGNRYFAGNQYIKNLFMTTLTPLVSYFTYVYYRMTRSKTWGFLFFYMAFLSVIVLTYDFSKSPIITYLLGLYLIEVAIGKIRNNKRFFRLALSACMIILFFYVIMLKAGDSLFSIYTGPMGRIIFTQIATLFLHVEAFPWIHPYLKGASFNHWMSFIIPAAEGFRSGRVVMTIYNPSGVETNTAGVMNTMFIGEAYANFGLFGIIIAPIIFGVVIGLFAYLIPSLKKTPLTVLLYVEMTLQFITMVEGGFVDIFYSASTIFIILIILFMKVCTGPEEYYRLA